MVNYSKWDSIVDEDEVPDRTADFEKRVDHHKASMQLIASQLKQAWPPLSQEQTGHLLDFVQAQHRGVFADNTKRAAEIVAFVEGRLAPSTRPLHALALFARRTEVDADEPARAQAKRVRWRRAWMRHGCPRAHVSSLRDRYSTSPCVRSTLSPHAPPPAVPDACTTRCCVSRRGRRAAARLRPHPRCTSPPQVVRCVAVADGAEVPHLRLCGRATQGRAARPHPAGGGAAARAKLRPHAL